MLEPKALVTTARHAPLSLALKVIVALELVWPATGVPFLTHCKFCGGPPLAAVAENAADSPGPSNTSRPAARTMGGWALVLACGMGFPARPSA